MAILELNWFDLTFFRSFIKNIYKLDVFNNPMVYDFYLDEVYYIHLIDINEKTFCVVPFQLSSDFAKNLNLVTNCFNILKKELDDFLYLKAMLNDEITIYISKNIVKRVNHDLLIEDLDYFFKEYNKLPKDILNSSVNVFKK